PPPGTLPPAPDRDRADHPAHRPAPGRATTACKTAAAAAVLTAVLAVSVLAAIGLGAAVVPPEDTARERWAALSGGAIGADEAPRYQLAWRSRTRRARRAAVVGAGLGAAGGAVQALGRNAGADPCALGGSSRACVGAAAVPVCGGL